MHTNITSDYIKKKVYNK